MPLNDKQIRHLKPMAHHLKPVVMVGQGGLHEAVLREIDNALDCHELIKVKIAAGDRNERDGIAARIKQLSGADLILSIGNMAVFFRANPKRKKPIRLPS